MNNTIAEILENAIPPETAAYWPVLTKQRLHEQTTGLDHGAGVTVQTSGTTGDPTVIHYTERDWDRMIDRGVASFEISGLVEEDVLMNLGAPLAFNHVSGQSIADTCERYGVETATDSFLDLDEALNTGTPLQDALHQDPEDVTAVIGVPLLLHALGERMVEVYGQRPDDLFPNMRIAVTSGDSLPGHLRASLRELWGVDVVKELYASTEFNFAGAEGDGTGMLPLSDSLLYECVPLDGAELPAPDEVHEHDIYSISEVPDGTTAALLLSDPDREWVDTMRYWTGDLIEIQHDDYPAFTFQGRTDDTISFAGAPIPEMQLDQALQDAYAEAYDEIDDWKAIVSRPDGTYPALDIYVVGDGLTAEPAAVYEQLAVQNDAVEKVTRIGATAHLDVHVASDRAQLREQLAAYDLDDELLGDGIKGARIGRDMSYA